MPNKDKAEYILQAYKSPHMTEKKKKQKQQLSSYNNLNKHKFHTKSVPDIFHLRLSSRTELMRNIHRVYCLACEYLQHIPLQVPLC